MIRQYLTEALTIVALAAILAVVIRGVGAAAGFTLVVIDGVSMEPLFHTGDIVLVKHVPPTDIHVNDIVVYKGCEGKLVIHRVYAVCKYGETYCYVTWGDNNISPDIIQAICSPVPCSCKTRIGVVQGIPYDRIIGKVVEVNGVVYKIPYVGVLALMLRSG